MRTHAAAGRRSRRARACTPCRPRPETARCSRSGRQRPPPRAHRSADGWCPTSRAACAPRWSARPDGRGTSPACRCRGARPSPARRPASLACARFPPPAPRCSRSSSHPPCPAARDGRAAGRARRPAVRRIPAPPMTFPPPRTPHATFRAPRPCSLPAPHAQRRATSPGTPPCARAEARRRTHASPHATSGARRPDRASARAGTCAAARRSPGAVRRRRATARSPAAPTGPRRRRARGSRRARTCPPESDIRAITDGPPEKSGGTLEAWASSPH